MYASRLLKGFNFLYFSLLAMFIAFLPVYLDEQGLQPSQIGFIIGTGGFVTLVAQPLWGMISDRLRTVRLILIGLLLASAVTGYMLFSAGSYVPLIGFALLLYFFLMPIDPLTESLNFTVAEASGVSYGSIRTFGAMGYGVSALLTGYAMSYFGMNSLSWMFGGIAILCLIIGWMMPDAPSTGRPVTWDRLKQFLGRRETLLFLLLVFICSVPARMNDTFLGVYIRELGGSPELVGLATFLAAGSEILVFALSFWWMRPGKELVIITIAAGFYFLRFFLTSWITDPHLLAYLQLLQMLTFPVFYSTAIQYLYRIVPAEWRATGQTVLALLFFGVSGILASYVGGAVYEGFGGRALFLFISSLSLIGTFFGLVLSRRYGTRGAPGAP
ncbi:MFS transporter [Paenibacillus puerhi]|uniref:MFS transporter n=1 Tax=Paenibacillus puerhi TaxID=2692622 RepID=UPI00135AFDFB|nr:MFS transporter [Paenibacillus puerhi]